MPRCAFLTMADMSFFKDCVYDQDAVGPLKARGWSVDEVPWQQGRPTDWSHYDLVVVRSTWDYQDAPEDFIAVLERINSATRLANPLSVIQWNLRKTYLKDLAAADVAVVPTLWADEGLTEGLLAEASERWGEIVAKPQVSASAQYTFRLASDRSAWETALETLAQRAVMVQPFLPSIVSIGEWSLFAFRGEVSHAILKTPAAGDFRVQEDYGGAIKAVEVTPELLEITQAALRAVPSSGPLLYARVDVATLADGSLAIMELELIEPSLYFPWAPGSAERFAAALDAGFAMRSS